MIVVCRVSTQCNLRCGFCAYDRRLPQPRRHLQLNQARKLIEGLAAWRERHGEHVLLSWIGGEPLLWPHWQSCSQLARQNGLAVSATSNGTTLTHRRGRLAVLQHLDEITLSLDAADSRHDLLRGWTGGCARLAQAIEKLVRERDRGGFGLLLRVNIVLMRSTIGDVEPLALWLAELGVGEISINLLGGRDRPEFHAREAVLPEQFRALLERLDDLRQALIGRGTRLLGGAGYYARLAEQVAGQARAVADCAPGEHFLFVDEHARIAPCAFTLERYGVNLDSIRSLDECAPLFRSRRSIQADRSCSDCPSTQVAGKFSGSLPVAETLDAAAGLGGASHGGATAQMIDQRLGILQNGVTAALGR